MEDNLFLIIAVGGISLILVIYYAAIKPRIRVNELEASENNLKDAIKNIENSRQVEQIEIEKRLSNTKDMNIGIVRPELEDIFLVNDLKIQKAIADGFGTRSAHDEKSREKTKIRVQQAINNEYLYRFISYMFPELSFDALTNDLFNLMDESDSEIPGKEQRMQAIIKIVDNLSSIKNGKETVRMQHRIDFLESLYSFEKSSKYISRLMADYETYYIEILAKKLDWGYSQERLHKVASIREIRAMARESIEKSKQAEYSLAYLLSQFPDLEKYLDVDEGDELANNEYEMPITHQGDSINQDEVYGYVTEEEYKAMSETERNQLALDRYSQRRRTKWQIGRDYELYISYMYRKQGYNVDEFGSYMRLADLGRDLIAKKDASTLIIQCKYWSKNKQIHEKHIFQLFGTVSMYKLETSMGLLDIKGVIVTNTELSPKAKTMADYLGILYKENVPAGDYPSIKCNIRNWERIYHLPFDQKYDDTIIRNKGEFYAFTVREAEGAGFRRARRWYGT
ncbi:MAG: restriction endonuclease [Christensenellales bacterium]